MEAAAAKTLAGKEDLYGGFIVDSSCLPSSDVDFNASLEASLLGWRGKYAGIWLRVPLQRAALVPLAAAQGFVFHHAEPEYVMMTSWLPAHESTLPPNASHQVGVGACVFNARGELLVVREKHGPAGKLGVWKIPTGLVQTGEHICDAIAREVLEETGLQAEFDCVLAMRQAHGFAFGKSDMFLLCGLRPSAAAPCGGDGRPLIKPCEKEIEDTRWLPFEEYCDSEFVQSRPTVRTLAKCMTEYQAGTYRGFRAEALAQGNGRSDLLLYGAEVDSVMPKGWENS